VIDATFPRVRDAHTERIRRALVEVFDAERDDASARLEAGIGVLLASRWDGELADVIAARSKDTAAEIGERVAFALGSGFDPDLMDEWLAESSRIAAEGINGSIREQLDGVDREGLDEVFRNVSDVHAPQYAVQLTTKASNFGAHDGAKAGGAEFKMWKTTSGNPRSSHSAMNGEVVRLSENFSNGLAWPGDTSGGPDEVANCMCALVFL